MITDLNYINLNGEISPNRRVLSRLVALNWKVPHHSHVRIPFSRFQNSFSLSLHCRMNCQILISLLLPKIQNHTTQITGNIGQESVEIIDVGSQGLVASDGSLNEIPSPRLINNWFLWRSLFPITISGLPSLSTPFLIASKWEQQELGGMINQHYRRHFSQTQHVSWWILTRNEYD